MCFLELNPMLEYFLIDNMSRKKQVKLVQVDILITTCRRSQK